MSGELAGGRSQRTRARASRVGVVPPVAWDDDERDDPGAGPAGTDPGLDVGGLGLEELFEDYGWLLEVGENPARAARRCGRSLWAITKAAEREGRQDLARAGYRELGQQRRKAERS